MKARSVILAPEAEDDLISIYDHVADNAAPSIAFAFVSRIETFCRSLSYAAERGTHHAAIRNGLRSVGFERRVTVVFHVSDETVSILRVFYAGWNWQDEFEPGG